ncbi:hypothetical protein ACIBU0_21795 [Streptomyces sp. NPDC049627]|uniref:hypothetical protein n=1 Tax=Streptomyces sp. NPDC049627 TaxID=3365595 RepID=UPI0037AD5383
MTHGHASGRALALDDAELEALLSAAVLRGHPVDSEREQRAVAAYLAARAAGAHRARTRHRDDWRPREQRRLARSLKTALSLFAASLTLGGVAFAAIGSSHAPDDAGDKGGPTPSAGASDRPGTGPSSAASGAASGKPEHPAAAQDTEAKCRAYDEVGGRGDALDSTAWQRLVTEAGGADKVAAYCAEQLARTTPTSRPGQTATPGRGAGDAANGADGSAANGADGGGADNAGNAESGADNAEGGAGNTNSGAGEDQGDKAPGNGSKN